MCQLCTALSPSQSLPGCDAAWCSWSPAFLSVPGDLSCEGHGSNFNHLRFWPTFPGCEQGCSPLFCLSLNRTVTHPDTLLLLVGSCSWLLQPDGKCCLFSCTWDTYTCLTSLLLRSCICLGSMCPVPSVWTVTVHAFCTCAASDSCPAIITCTDKAQEFSAWDLGK